MAVSNIHVSKCHDQEAANEDVLTKLGAKYECGEPWSVKVCVDGGIFTGQNPPSAGPLAEAVIKSFA